MVKIIEENRPLSVGQRFAKAFQGLGESLPTALGEFEKERKEKELKIAKKKAKIRPGVKSFLSLYDKNQFFKSNPEQIAALEERTSKYVDQGFEPDEAVTAAYHDILSGSPDQGSATPEKSEFAKAFSGDPELLQKLGIASKEGILSDIGRGLQKGGRIGVSLLDIPFQLAREANYMGRGNFETLTDLYDKLTEGKAKPTNVAEEYAYGLPFGPAGVAAVHAEKTLETAGLPESVQRAGGIISFLAAHRLKVPAVKDILGKAKKVSEATGVSTEEVLASAQKESGVNLEKVAEGDKQAVSEFSKKITETPKVAEKVSEAPKTFFNKKAAEKQREIFGAKLPESPLEEYYDIRAKEIEKEAAKRPETIARDKEIRERLAPEENRLYTELRTQTEQLKNIERELKGTSFENKDRIEVLRDFQSKKINQTLENLKDIQYEMKYGRPRPSEAEINAQIEKSIVKFKEGIENPTEKTQKDITHQLELDKKYLDRASKLIDRGELPGEIRPDTHIKMKQKYLEGYKSAIENARNEVAELKGETDAASRKKIIENQELVKRLTDRIKRLQWDIVNQTDNIKAMRALEKPSGAFYKQQIKSLKKDNALFKDDLFKHKRLKTPEELKTQKVFKGEASKIEKGRELIESPTKEKIEEAAKDAGKDETEFTKALKQVREEVKASKKKVDEGTVDPKIESKLFKKIKGFAAYVGGGTALGVIQGLSEEIFNIKPDSKLLRIISRFVGLGSLGSSTFGYKMVRDYFDSAQADELIKLRSNPAAWNRYIKNMEAKHGNAKVKRVLKKVNEV